MYIVELHNRLSNGEKYNDILKDYKVWQKGLIESGMNILKKLKMLK
jgi:hypothetical protein